MGGSGESRLRFQVRPSGNRAFSSVAQLDIATPGGSQYWRPDVGGVESFAAGDRALVVYQSEDNSATGGAWL